jgi:uncharacterized repeat protein (TIGR03843 family)
LPPLELDPAARRAFLREAELEVLGRMPWSSNATLLAVARVDDREVQVIYKPRRGERPLWDFPTGTLCQREVAAYELSALLGWGLVPETVLRDGPVGEGMVQEFVDHDPDDHYFTLLEDHEDVFRRFAVFDVLINNADRKGGHCLRRLADGVILGIDHGLSFHPAWKLRTVIWEFGGEPIPSALADDVCRIAEAANPDVEARLGVLLSPLELEALRMRAGELLRAGTLPNPDPGYHSLPWPLV